MQFEFEIFPSKKLHAATIPPDWLVAISCRQQGIQSTLDLYRLLGPQSIPHVSAAMVESESHLKEIARTVSDKVFLIAGDPKPRGPYSRAAQLIPFFQHCREIGVAGYPEGHPAYPYEALGDEILLEKQRLGATYIVTQLSFDSQAIIDWVKRIRGKGVELPVYCGVSSPINVVRLAQFARQCGVGQSLRFLGKISRWDATKMIARYDPAPLMAEVYDFVDGFHIYTFNAIKTTERWLEEMPWLSTREKVTAP
jgi:methylenetetrahydrofolate reductase (NADPH)